MSLWDKLWKDVVDEEEINDWLNFYDDWQCLIEECVYEEGVLDFR